MHAVRGTLLPSEIVNADVWCFMRTLGFGVLLIRTRTSILSLVSKKLSSVPNVRAVIDYHTTSTLHRQDARLFNHVVICFVTGDVKFFFIFVLSDILLTVGAVGHIRSAWESPVTDCGWKQRRRCFIVREFNILFLQKLLLTLAGFPRAFEKVLNCEIGFQDHVKLLNLPKIYIKYWKTMEIP